jgi:hypothetical protein
MRSFHNFLRIIIIFGIPTGSRPVEETTSLEQRTPSSEHPIPDMAFPDALIAMKDTVNRVSAANGQFPVLDGATLDDLQRLLDIIASHVERMREATQGNNSGTTSNSNTHPNPNAGKAPARIHNKANENIQVTNNKKPHPMAIPPGAVIVNHGSMSGDKEDHNGDESPKGELHVTSDEHGFTNITCKGISVCNPVTVISGKDGKKIKLLDKLDKADRKKNKKKFKSWMKGKDKDV